VIGVLRDASGNQFAGEMNPFGIRDVKSFAARSD
jgi:hypothetical protein